MNSSLKSLVFQKFFHCIILDEIIQEVMRSFLSFVYFPIEEASLNQHLRSHCAFSLHILFFCVDLAQTFIDTAGAATVTCEMYSLDLLP